MPRFVLFLVSLFALAACQHSQTCRDGVCEIVENGKVRYEGDAQKIAAFKQKQVEAQRADILFVKSLSAAPKREKTEPIRVAFIGYYANDAELSALAPAYLDMMRAEMAQFPNIQVVDPNSVAAAMAYKESIFNMGDDYHSQRFNNGSASKGGAAPEAFPYTIDGLKRLRHAGLRTDVVVFTWIKPKTKTGIVAGKGGAGLIQGTFVDFQTKFGELYAFKSFTAGAVGDGSSNIAAAGWNNKGKYGAGELKFKRNPESDRKAIKSLVKQIRAKINLDVRPRLAKLTVQERLEGERFANLPQAKRTLSKEEAVEELKKTGLEKVKSLFKK